VVKRERVLNGLWPIESVYLEYLGVIVQGMPKTLYVQSCLRQMGFLIGVWVGKHVHGVTTANRSDRFGSEIPLRH